MAEVQQGVTHVVLVPAILSYKSSAAIIHVAWAKAIVAVILWVFINDCRIRNVVGISVVGETGQPIFQPPLQRELESVVTRSCLVKLGLDVHARQRWKWIRPTLGKREGQLVDIGLGGEPAS